MFWINIYMFKACKYTIWYYNIIRLSQQRSHFPVYTERHHIIPKCLGGTNKKDNLVQLTAREHFICHLLLTRMTESAEDKRKMWYAAWCLISFKGRNKERNFKFNSRSFEKIREYRSKQVSIMRTGRKHTNETKKLIGEKSKTKTFSDEYRAKLSLAAANKKDSEEVKKRKSEAAKARWAKVSEQDRKEHTKAATNSRIKT
jgi:hypothetical protein